MHVVQVRNVNEALPLGLRLLQDRGVARDSRNGPVAQADSPVVTVYERPCERVLFSPVRDANPFFHLMEGLWMLAGRNDLKLVTTYVSTMANYSDDGATLWGAYGKRWRGWFAGSGEDAPDDFGPDQLSRVIAALKANPEDRRQVISMWDPYADPEKALEGGKDVPCNTHIYVSIAPDGRLELTLCCRSNDMVWGAYGANAVHFSMLQEYLAGHVGVPVGRLFQMSNNFHAYEKTSAQVASLALLQDPHDPYRAQGDREPVAPYPMVSVDQKTWDEDLHMFLKENVTIGLREPFFRRVAQPIARAHQHYRTRQGHDRFLGALEIIEQCAATDWRQACTEWLQRRYDAWQAKQTEETTS